MLSPLRRCRWGLGLVLAGAWLKVLPNLTGMRRHWEAGFASVFSVSAILAHSYLSSPSFAPLLETPFSCWAYRGLGFQVRRVGRLGGVGGGPAGGGAAGIVAAYDLSALAGSSGPRLAPTQNLPPLCPLSINQVGRGAMVMGRMPLERGLVSVGEGAVVEAAAFVEGHYLEALRFTYRRCRWDGVRWEAAPGRVCGWSSYEAGCARRRALAGCAPIT